MRPSMAPANRFSLARRRYAVSGFFCPSLSHMRLLKRHTGVGPEPANSGCGRRFKETMMSKSATFVRHKAKPGKRDDLWRVWEKYVRDYVAGSNGALSCY